MKNNNVFVFFFNVVFSGLDFSGLANKCPFLEWRPAMKILSRAVLAEHHLAGSIFGNMPFELFAPEGLKRVAASIQCFEFSGTRPFTAQITPLYRFVIHPGVLFHVRLSDFIFYWAGITGFTGYFSIAFGESKTVAIQLKLIA